MRVIGVSRRSDVPWFRDRARWAIAAAVALFVAVFAMRLLIGDSEDAVGLLYALPVALVAVAFGRAAGIAAGLLAVVLVLTWAAVLETAS